MSDLLQEYCDSRGVPLRVDRAGGVIRGVKILGPTSRNGREYLPEALARAVGLYDGAKVNVNHPKGHPLSPRDYQERIGVIRNVQHRAGEGIFADFHFNPKHYLSEQLIWDAEHAPENVGFSHNVQARTARRGETTLVEEILRVHSVDLVADPATTHGLFESTVQRRRTCQQRRAKRTTDHRRRRMPSIITPQLPKLRRLRWPQTCARNYRLRHATASNRRTIEFESKPTKSIFYAAKSTTCRPRK